jgi:hypothetical protein
MIFLERDKMPKRERWGRERERERVVCAIVNMPNICDSSRERFVSSYILKVKRVFFS